MREGHEACQISLLYVLFSLFGHDGAQRSMTFLAFCFLFVCLFVVVVVVVFFHNVALIYSINFLTIF